MASTGTDDAVTFVISVAAELAGMHPQTLRQYDRLGLVIPARTKGRGRRYTKRDVQRLRDVQRMSQEEGINLAGIRRILELERRVEALEEERDALRDAVRSCRYGEVSGRGIARHGVRMAPVAPSPCGALCALLRRSRPPRRRRARSFRHRRVRRRATSSKGRSSPSGSVHRSCQ